MVGERLDEVSENVFRVPSRVNSTWGGNLTDMVRCRLYLEVYREENLLDQVRRTGALLLEELQALAREFPGKISNPRGLGLLCAFDLPSADFRKQFRQKLFDRRLIILPCGERSLRFRTALNITAEELYQGLDIIRRTLRES
jgi:L-lysine 6-transaminase